MNFPLLYQAHHQDYKTDIPFWLGVSDHYGDPILELGCGTGRVLLHLAALGKKVFGLDNDEGMIKKLNLEIPPELYPNIQSYIADMSNFHLGLDFPLVILPCNTYSTLDQNQRLSTLQCVHNHLLQNGAFVFSMPNIEIFRQLPEYSEPEMEASFFHPNSGNPVQVSSGWNRIGSALKIVWNYDHLLPNGHIERLDIAVEHDLQSIQAYREEIHNAGFIIQNEYGDFDLSDFGPASYYWIVIARKKT